jgi:bacillithiol system protein YtxJ
MLLQIKFQNQNLTEKKQKSGMTDIEWNELSNTGQLDQLDSQSKEAPVVIFKHSTRCSISAAALDRIERRWDPAKAGELKPYFLDLIQYREVSNEIANRYGVDHASPQILLIRDGKVTYHNSHFGISFDDLIENITSVSI